MEKKSWNSSRMVVVFATLCVMALCVGFTSAATPVRGTNGALQSGTRQELATSLIIDGGWTDFSWGGGGGRAIYANEGPFTFTAVGPVALRITDAYCMGDQFRIYDFGVPLGNTSTPNNDDCAVSNSDPDYCFASTDWSHGEFPLGPGAHSIDIEVIANPFGSGGAFIKVDTSDSTYDVSLYDDYSRSQLCLDSVSGMWTWTILRGQGAISSFTGTGVVSLKNQVLYLDTPKNIPITLHVQYHMRYHKASASFNHRILRLRSVLIDTNTLNDPPCRETPSE